MFAVLFAVLFAVDGPAKDPPERADPFRPGERPNYPDDPSGASLDFGNGTRSEIIEGFSLECDE